MQAKQTRVQCGRWQKKKCKKCNRNETSAQRGISRPKQRQNQKSEIPGGEFFCTGQASVHPQRIRPWWRRKRKKKSGLEMRQECISTSLSFACKTRERLSSVPASNPTWTGAGAWEQFLGHALLSPCPLLPCCQEGETVRRKRGRNRNHEVTNCAYTLPLKIRNPPRICIKVNRCFLCVCVASQLCDCEL